MAKRTSTKQTHSWAVYHVNGTQFVGIVEAPDEETAIKKAIEEFKVPGDQRNRLTVHRRD